MFFAGVEFIFIRMIMLCMYRAKRADEVYTANRQMREQRNHLQAERNWAALDEYGILWMFMQLFAMHRWTYRQFFPTPVPTGA